VEHNPPRAGIVPRAKDCSRSSAAGHCSLAADELLSPDLDQPDNVGTWRPWLLDEDDQTVRLIRGRTRTKHPCGRPEFVQRLERLLGRPLAAKKRGRKPEQKKQKAE